VEDEIVYTFILCKTDGSYLGWSKAPEVTEAGAGMQWIEWNKPLPDDIDEVTYKYENDELVKCHT